mmetsp:Transcript_2792/g.8342  ORF Transcript_2792/g.8342 Transcript_2792/m.8342 type:complete len:212 (-) Transcript_2792:1767-2402(-)
MALQSMISIMGIIFSRSFTICSVTICRADTLSRGYLLRIVSMHWSEADSSIGSATGDALGAIATNPRIPPDSLAESTRSRRTSREENAMRAESAERMCPHVRRFSCLLALRLWPFWRAFSGPSMSSPKKYLKFLIRSLWMCFSRKTSPTFELTVAVFWRMVMCEMYWSRQSSAWYSFLFSSDIITCRGRPSLPASSNSLALSLLDVATASR